MKSTSRFEQVNIDRLIPHARNARTHSKEQILQLRSSLREFGFVNPVIVDKDLNIIAGHGRVAAAKAEGMTEVPCVFAEHLTEAQKRAYILADNRLALSAGCVRILSESVASLPLHVYRYNDSGDPSRAGGKEKALTHPLYGILHDEPNPEMSAFSFRETLMTHLLLFGNGFAQIIRNGRGEVVSLYPLMPDRMAVDRDSRGRLYYAYIRSDGDTRTLGGKPTIVLAPSDVLHIPGLGFDGLVGYSPIAMAKQAIGMGLACDEYGAAFFQNGAQPGGVLEHPGVVKDPKRVRESWNAIYQGSANAHRVAVLEEGMAYKPISISPEQAQFLETRKFQIDEIARIFRVPPHMVGDLDKSSFSNIEQQSLEFVKYTLSPWITRWEQSIHRALLLPGEKQRYFVRFNVEGLLRGDYKSRMDGYAVARQNGWMSANDIRELENLDRIPAEDGGDLFLINGNMTKLSDAGAFAAGRRSEEDFE